MNLIEGIQREMNRVRELRTQYVAIGPTGIFGKVLIDDAIRKGEQSIASGDVVEMLRAYKNLEEFTG